LAPGSVKAGPPGSFIYHSHQVLIHNAHFGKIPSFCKILDLKITHLKEMFDLYFCLSSAIVIQAWHSKVKTIALLHKIACISKEKIPQTCVKTQVSFVN
jgi:hypothetical protein